MGKPAPSTKRRLAKLKRDLVSHKARKENPEMPFLHSDNEAQAQVRCMKERQRQWVMNGLRALRAPMVRGSRLNG